MATPKTKTPKKAPKRKEPKERNLTVELARFLDKILLPDLEARAKQRSIRATLEEQYNRARARRSTAEKLPEWTKRTLEQVGVAWILSCAFVRALEDRGFLSHSRLVGEGALDSEHLFRDSFPSLTIRDYLLSVFRELSHMPGGEDVLGPRHNPAWRLSPSVDAVRQLVAFFREEGSDGMVVWTFNERGTHVLGNLYQNLSSDVRKRYALLQTPEFVERFILDETLEPAIREFGLENVRLIDPTCGSGHFLLGAFDRVFDHRVRAMPGRGSKEHALAALNQIYGVDINPYAVAIARFRLTLSFLEKAGIERLAAAPRMPLNLAVGDSLLIGAPGQSRLSERSQDREAWGDHMFDFEDVRDLERIYAQKYHAVVGNPPYITCKDKALRETYRRLYKSASGDYALAVPFTERFFQTAADGGFVGLINSNAWTKRDYGATLIRDVLRHLDLQKIVDSSGCYIPGHGTPTLMLFGRNRLPVSEDVVAVLGKRGERSEPDDPAAAPVWSEIVAHHNEPGFEGTYVSVEALPRVKFGEPPWILAGGGARRLYEDMSDHSRYSLEELVEDVGYASFPGLNDAFVMPQVAARNAGIPNPFIRTFVAGKAVRDWDFESRVAAVAPYDKSHVLVDLASLARGTRHFWRLRTYIRSTTDFGGKTRGQSDDPYWGWYRWHPERYAVSARLVFPYVATHNHFVLDRGGRVFNQHAPIIFLREEFLDADYEVLTGYLNSSTTAFWCRLVMLPKGGDQVGDGARLSKTPWQDRLEYAGNLLQQIPVPDLGRMQDSLRPLVVAVEDTVRALAAAAPELALTNALDRDPTATSLREACEQHAANRRHLRCVLVSLQEEMDWQVYGLLGLPTVCAPSVEAVRVPVQPEWRPFEVRLAREVDSDISAAEWFRIHQHAPPASVGGPLEDLYGRRLRLLDDSERGTRLRLLETPETKRRWPPRDYAAEFELTARGWLLDRIESLFSGSDLRRPTPLTVRQMTTDLASDSRVAAVHEFLSGGADQSLGQGILDVVDAEAVPFLAAMRHTASGLEKRASWELSWDLQRAEDKGTLRDALSARGLEAIPEPRTYVKNDFRLDYWDLRGKVDVPRERFIFFPGAERDDDPSIIYGWAGWDHLQQATAIAGLYHARKRDEGWGTSEMGRERLVPLLAGLLELVPWLKQWHNAPNDEFDGEGAGDWYEHHVEAEARSIGRGLDDLRSWRPQQKATLNRVRSKAKLPALNDETDED